MKETGDAKAEEEKPKGKRITNTQLISLLCRELYKVTSRTLLSSQNNPVLYYYLPGSV